MLHNIVVQSVELQNRREVLNNIAGIKLYGHDRCSDCVRSERLLKALNVAYTKIDVHADLSAADKVIEINGGNLSVPLICFPDGTHLTEPSDQDLKAKLISLRII